VDRVVGIDLGTTNSVVAYTDANGVTDVIAGKDGDRIVPSVVYFPPSGDPVVGSRAKQYAIVEPDRVAKLFKRGMGERTFRPDGNPFVVDGKTWLPEELSALVLRKLAQMAEEHFGEPVRRAVVSVPAYFGEPERAATRSAGELAGLEIVRIINEPTAAAFAHGLDHPGEASRVLVFDLGGGTFDVTIMDVGQDGALEVVGTGGDRQLGGADFDQLIVDRMAAAARESGGDITADPWTKQDAYLKAEEIKKELSAVETATRPITAGGRPVMFSLSRSDFERLVAKQLQGVEDITLYTIEKAGLQPADITTVLMVGGSSRIPAFQRLLARTCGQEPRFSRNLDEDVARGAAILATKLGGELNPRSQLATIPPPVDVASHGLGITVVEDVRTGVEINKIMIAAGTTIPVSTTDTFSTVHDDQTAINVRLNEGDDEDLEYVRQLGESVGRFPAPVPRNHPIRVEMSYTAEQLIRVQAFDGVRGTFLCEFEVPHAGLMSAGEKQAARELLASMDVS
jgi:molecular chaperone DnaK